MTKAAADKEEPTTKADKANVQEYYIPSAEVTVEATSVEEAVAKAKKLTAKDGDANL